VSVTVRRVNVPVRLHAPLPLKAMAKRPRCGSIVLWLQKHPLIRWALMIVSRSARSFLPSIAIPLVSPAHIPLDLLRRPSQVFDVRVQPPGEPDPEPWFDRRKVSFLVRDVS
jgi:hypothetical protein